jgi:thioredoxin-related protein
MLLILLLLTITEPSKVVLYSSDDCSHCIRMEKEIRKDAELAPLLTVVKRHSYRSVPVVVVEKDGKEVLKRVGYQNVETIRKALK